MDDPSGQGARREYDLFISYARKDDVADSSGRGWVTGIRDLIEEDSRAVQGREFSVFFDSSEIHGMQDWRARIQGALRTSKVMLVCLSPNYFDSDPCRWEWEEYRQRQARVMARIGAGETDDGTIATVFFIEAPGSDPSVSAKWRDEVMRTDGLDLRPWFPEGATALGREQVRARVRGLGDDIWKRIERARRAETAVGNLMRFNPYFVGRTAELQALDETLRRPASIGVVSAVHGLGGLGKTELTVQYAHAYREVFSGGVWLLRAEGHADLLALAATLTDAPEFAFVPTPEIARDPQLLGRAVLQELLRRCRHSPTGDDQPGAVLVILDNVTDPGLLAEPQVAQLPRDPQLRFVATTRLGEPDFVTGRASLAFVPVPELSVDDGLTLIRDHQPVRDDGLPGFASPAQEQAARDLVALLGGLTLAIEQAAIYLGVHPETSPADYLQTVRSLGLVDVEAQVSHDPLVAPGMRHQDRTVAAILAATLADFDPATRTTLQLSALLPPDTVPWPWLKEIVAFLHPEAIATPFSPQGGWARIQRTLAGRRLLTPSGVPGVARLHRLYREHLATGAPPELAAALAQHLVNRAQHVNGGDQADPWEYVALLDTLIPLIPGNPQLATALNLDADDSNFSDRLRDYIGDGRPLTLARSILAEVEQLADTQPGNLTTQRDLGIALTNVARMQEDSDPDQALRLYRRSLTICEQLADTQPGNLTAQRDLGITLNNVARMLQHSDPAQALRLYQRSLTICEQLTDTQPGNLTAQRDLGIALDNVARMQEDSDPAQALRLYQRSLTIREQLTDIQPGNLSAQRGLGIALDNVARMQEDSDPAQALRLYQRSLAICEQRADTQPGNLSAQRELGIALNNVARMLQRSDLAQALRLYQRSLTIREQRADTQPGNLSAQRELGIALTNVARMQEDSDPAQALRLSRRSLTICEQLADTQPGNLTAQRELGIALTNVARMQEDSDPAQALRLYQRSLTIREQLADTQPGNLTAQRDLGIALDKVARMQEDSDPAQALRLSRRSLTIHEQLADTQPGNLTYAQGLYRSLWLCASLTERVLGIEPALDVWQRCWQQLKRCEERGWLPISERWLLDAAARKAGIEYTFLDRWLQQALASPTAPGPSEPTADTTHTDARLLDAVSLDCLPANLKRSLLAAIAAELESRVGEGLAERFPEDQLAEIEGLINDGDQSGALEWLSRNAPDHQEVVRQERAQLVRQLQQKAPEIRDRLCAPQSY